MSFSQLFIGSRLLFILEIELSIFDWLIFIVSSSLLQWSVFLSIIFIPLMFLLSPFWTRGLGNWWALFHYLFFQEIPLAVLIESSSSTFSFYLTFSISMNLGEAVIYCGLEGMFYLRASLCRLCVQCLWCKGWFWYGCQSRLSSGCAGHYHLYKWCGWLVSGACARHEAELSLCSMAVTALSWVESVPQLLE